MEIKYRNKPEPGYWLMKLGKGTVESPCSIQLEQTTHEPGNPENVMDRSPFLVARINGEPVDIELVWERSGRAITKAEYLYHIADAEWLRQHQPDHPKANPTQKVDFLKVPLPF